MKRRTALLSFFLLLDAAITVQYNNTHQTVITIKSVKGAEKERVLSETRLAIKAAGEMGIFHENLAVTILYEQTSKQSQVRFCVHDSDAPDTQKTIGKVVFGEEGVEPDSIQGDDLSHAVEVAYGYLSGESLQSSEVRVGRSEQGYSVWIIDIPARPGGHIDIFMTIKLNLLVCLSYL